MFHTNRKVTLSVPCGPVKPGGDPAERGVAGDSGRKVRLQKKESSVLGLLEAFLLWGPHVIVRPANPRSLPQPQGLVTLSTDGSLHWKEAVLTAQVRTLNVPGHGNIRIHV